MQLIETKNELDTEQMAVVKDILSQAISGELIGMSNFASLAGMIDDIHEKMEAVEHAHCERGHAEGFMNISRQFDIVPEINVEGHYWKRVRDSFLKYAKQKDLIACLIIQEVMLECFAVSMYHDIGHALNNEIGDLFRAISDEEKEHIEHSIHLLQSELNSDPEAFVQKVEIIHWDCMTILAEWTAGDHVHCRCGVCADQCVKESLHMIGLTLSSLRGNALNLYLKTLDRIGLPPQKSLEWVINLPA
ncbi:MAG: long-chain fatty aldehyde decarbonylase [Chitinophagales bacterium]